MKRGQMIWVRDDEEDDLQVRFFCEYTRNDKNEPAVYASVTREEAEANICRFDPWKYYRPVEAKDLEVP